MGHHRGAQIHSSRAEPFGLENRESLSSAAPEIQDLPSIRQELQITAKALRDFFFGSPVAVLEIDIGLLIADPTEIGTQMSIALRLHVRFGGSQGSAQSAPEPLGLTPIAVDLLIYPREQSIVVIDDLLKTGAGESRQKDREVFELLGVPEQAIDLG